MNITTQFKEEKEKLLQNIKELYKLSYCKNLLSDIKAKIEETQKQDITYHEIRNTLTGVYKLNTQRSMIIDMFIIVLKEQFEKMQTQNNELNKIISNFKVEEYEPTN